MVTRTLHGSRPNRIVSLCIAPGLGHTHSSSELVLKLAVCDPGLTGVLMQVACRQALLTEQL
jgi:hypothetical protein